MRRWWRILLLLVLLLGVVGCGTPATVQEDGPGIPEQAALERAIALGIAPAGPLPEYHLALEFKIPNRRLMGREHVTIPNRTDKNLNEIVFRLYPNLPQYGGTMSIGPTWVDGQRSTSVLRAEGTSLVVPLALPLAPQASVSISLTFDVEVPYYNTGYSLLGHSEDIWSMPDAYALLAVHDGRAWHEDLAPSQGDAVAADAALYDVQLTLPPTLTLVTTGSVIGDVLNEEGQRVYHISGGPLREFAWLASTKYRSAEATASGAVVRSYYLPGDETAGQAALNIAAAALRVYSDAFGPYPFPEMSVAEAPLLHYGMEYPGLNLIGLSLYRDKRRGLEDRVAHEIAHQWWYAQVGNDQVNVPWLDEGLAEYSTAIYYQQVFGQARANTLVNQRWLAPYQSAVENGYDAVVNQPSSAFGKEYEVMVYAKAALFFEALRKKVGEDVYRAVMHEYVDKYRWQIATPQALLQVAESVSGQELDGLYNRWILSKQ